jgi:hypothetical protein
VVIAVLAVVAGLALVAAGFFGGARWLIVPALALVIPLGVVAAADLDFEGGVGDRYFKPASAAEVQDRYELGLGELDLDLRDVDLPPGRTDVALDVGFGAVTVYVPDDLCVTSDFQAGMGSIDLLGRHHEGLDVAVAAGAGAPAGEPELHLDADVAIGELKVATAERFTDRSDAEWFASGESPACL